LSEIEVRLNVALAGRYEIERRLGEGGMATVYLAEDLKHDRKVALNPFHPGRCPATGVFMTIEFGTGGAACG